MNSREPIFQLNSRFAFTLSALLFVALILWLASAYPPRARQVPETVAIFSAICLLIQLVLDSSPRLASYYGRLEKKGFFSVDEKVQEARSSDASEFRLEVVAYGWLAFLLTGLLLFGFLVWIPFYILLYLHFQAALSWLRSLIYAIGTSLFVYLLFVRLFEIRLYPGILLESFLDF